ncbi:hypothetical protein DL96DRAFT_1495636 [Flagelloscypha sp. PMI_526]|nr:hypothetical protein DL96DRAFT_1495636 [Flagelloscypha sp. PMI_526]
MSVRVELPTYSYTWNIAVGPTSTVANLKDQIFQTCPGQPLVSGQRLLCKGRLLRDEERLSDVWPSLHESRVVHLAVSPGAWTGEPPTPLPPQPSINPTPSNPMPSAPIPHIPSYSSSSSLSHPLTYVLYKHQQALSLLSRGEIEVTEPGDIQTSRTAARRLVKRAGWRWPPCLDDPVPSDEGGGLTYQVSVVDGQTYLKLLNPGAKPSPSQMHAFSLLNATFPILFLPAEDQTPVRSIPSQQVPLSPNVVQHLPQLENHLRQMGLNPARAAADGAIANANANVNLLQQEIRGILFRQTIYSYIYLAFRTVLLLYFVSPTRKPVFAALVLAWVLYEIWRPIRAGLDAAAARRAVQNNRNDMAAPGPNANAPGPQANGDQGQAHPAPPAVPRGNLETQFLDNLATVNLAEEDIILERDEGSPPPPSLGHRISTFVRLLFVTVHPALWNRRRTALRLREGRIKTEANGRTHRAEPRAEGEEPTAEEQARAELRTELIARHARRPAWVREYINRVVSGEFVDDAD